ELLHCACWGGTSTPLKNSRSCRGCDKIPNLIKGGSIVSGCLTVRSVAPVLPSTSAVIEAVPAEIPVARPVAGETRATFSWELDQTIDRSVSTDPSAARIVALNSTVPPAAISGETGVTSTLATGFGVTINCVVALCPS